MMTVQIPIKGVIVANDYKEVYDFYGIESVSPNDVINALPDDNSPIELIINSPGGMVDAGSEIYTIIKEYAGDSTSKIVGEAASAASIAAIATDKTLISPTGIMMIHNAANGVFGDHNTMRKRASMLETVSEGVANAYILKTGKTREELKTLMDQTTYFNAHQAKEHGFVDEIMFENDIPVLTNSVVNSVLLPQSVIEKTRVLKKNATENAVVNFNISEEQIESVVEKVVTKLQKTNEPNPAPIVVKRRGFIF